MTLVRILALALLLGSASAGLVWFTWGAVGIMVRGRQPAPSADAAEEPKAPKQEKEPISKTRT